MGLEHYRIVDCLLKAHCSVAGEKGPAGAVESMVDAHSFAVVAAEEMDSEVDMEVQGDGLYIQ